MMQRIEVLALVCFAGICAVGVIVCAVVQVTVPGVLGDLAFAAIGGAAGVSHPGRATPPSADPAS